MPQRLPKLYPRVHYAGSFGLHLLKLFRWMIVSVSLRIPRIRQELTDYIPACYAPTAEFSKIFLEPESPSRMFRVPSMQPAAKRQGAEKQR